MFFLRTLNLNFNVRRMLRLGEAMLRLGSAETLDFIDLLRCYA